MLKVLIVAATGSLIFEYMGADSEDYSHGKCIFHPRAGIKRPLAFKSRLGQAQGVTLIQLRQLTVKRLSLARSRPFPEIYLIIIFGYFSLV